MYEVYYPSTEDEVLGCSIKTSNKFQISIYFCLNGKGKTCSRECLLRCIKMDHSKISYTPLFS